MNGSIWAIFPLRREWGEITSCFPMPTPFSFTISFSSSIFSFSLCFTFLSPIFLKFSPSFRILSSLPSIHRTNCLIVHCLSLTMRETHKQVSFMLRILNMEKFKIEGMSLECERVLFLLFIVLSLVPRTVSS